MSFFNYNITADEMQTILHENLEKIAERIELKEKIVPKLQNVIDKKQFERFEECGIYLETGENGKIIGGNFCRHRLCPVCNRRNSAQKWAKMYNIIQNVQKDFNCCFAFVTYTVKNVEGKQLAEEISKLMKSVDRLHKRALFQNNVLGFFRSLEITFNKKSQTFHPHFHYIIALDRSYKNNVISTYEWRKTWEQVARLNYTSQVNIKMINDDNIAEAVAEVAKYAVKISSVIEQDAETIKTLQNAIRARRLISFGGILKEYAKENTYKKYDKLNGTTMWIYNRIKKKFEGGEL